MYALLSFSLRLIVHNLNGTQRQGQAASSLASGRTVTSMQVTTCYSSLPSPCPLLWFFSSALSIAPPEQSKTQSSTVSAKADCISYFPFSRCTELLLDCLCSALGALFLALHRPSVPSKRRRRRRRSNSQQIRVKSHNRSLFKLSSSSFTLEWDVLHT